MHLMCYCKDVCGAPPTFQFFSKEHEGEQIKHVSSSIFCTKTVAHTLGVPSSTALKTPPQDSLFCILLGTHRAQADHSISSSILVIFPEDSSHPLCGVEGRSPYTLLSGRQYPLHSAEWKAVAPTLC